MLLNRFISLTKSINNSYRKKQEYLTNFKLLLCEDKYLIVQNMLENAIKNAKDNPVSKVETNILDMLCYNKNKDTAMQDWVSVIANFKL